MSDTAPGNAGQKQQRGRFRKGESGNPAGKRPGTRNRASTLLEAINDADLAAIVAKIVEKAKSGDATAAKILLDRLMPVPRTRTVALDLPSMADGTARSQAACLAAVLDAVAAGAVDPVEGAIVAGLVEKAGDAARNCGGFGLPSPLTKERRHPAKLQPDGWPKLTPFDLSELK